MCILRTTTELMLSTHVVLQMSKLTKSFSANITFVRPLVRVNTHVDFQTTRLSKTLLAHIAFVRFLFRVLTHVCGQFRWCYKHLLTNIALVPSLSLHSFSNKSSFFFSHLVILLHDIVARHAHNPPQLLYVLVFSLFFLYLMICLHIIIRNPRTHKHQRFFFPTYLQNRPRVHRAFRMWILSWSSHVVVVL